MVNKIKLRMNENKSIEVFVDEISKCVIESNNRVLSAKQIYDIFDYKKDFKYEIETENNNKRDEVVLNCFKDLFVEICKRINDLSSEKPTVDDDAQEEGE